MTDDDPDKKKKVSDALGLGLSDDTTESIKRVLGRVHDREKNEEKEDKREGSKDSWLKSLFSSGDYDHPFYKKISIFDQSSIIFWIVFFIFVFFAFMFSDNEIYSSAAMLILFLLLMFRPRFIHFLDIQLFGETNKESNMGKFFKLALIGLFVWIGITTGSIYLQAMIIAVFLIVELFMPICYKMFLYLESKKQSSRRSAGKPGRSLSFKFLMSILLDLVDLGVFFYFPSVYFMIGSDALATVLCGTILWGPGFAIFGIADLILSCFGLGHYFPSMIVAGLFAYFSGSATRSITGYEMGSLGKFSAKAGKVIFAVIIGVLVICTPVALITGGRIQDVPGVLMYQAMKSGEYAEMANLNIYSVLNQTYHDLINWGNKQVMIGQGDYYTGRVDKYSNRKLGVFIEKAEPYENNFYLDLKGEQDAIIGIDLEGEGLEIQDCDEYLEEGESPVRGGFAEQMQQQAEQEARHGFSGMIEDMKEDIKDELSISERDEEIIRAIIDVSQGRSATIDLSDIGDADASAQEGSESLSGGVLSTITSRLYADYDDCIRDQTIYVSCGVDSDKLKFAGNVTPDRIEMYDLIGGGEGFECFIYKGDLDQDRRSENVKVKVTFPFTTKAYLKTYLMNEEKKRDMKRSGTDILKFYSIKDINPKPVYTAGPIMIGMETPQDLPLAVRQDEEGKSTRLGITIDNGWKGTIKKINLMWFIVPKGINFDCGGYTLIQREIDDSIIYEVDSSHFDREFDIKDMKTFYCRMTPTIEALDPSPVTTKYVKMIIKYDYEISKDVIMTYRKGDSIQSGLDNCEDMCSDDDGCYCTDAGCKYAKVIVDRNCNGESRKVSASQKPECVDIKVCSDYDNYGCSKDYCDYDCYPIYISTTFSSCASCKGMIPRCDMYPNQVSCGTDACNVVGCIWDDAGNLCKKGAGITGSGSGTTGGSSGSTGSGGTMIFTDNQQGQIMELIRQIAPDIDVPVSLALAVADQESSFRQFKDDGSVFTNGEDYGVMQINKRVWSGTYDFNKIETDAEYNIRAGLRILRSNYENAPTYGKYYSMTGKRYFGWDYALRAYNGWGSGGDDNYVENVRKKELKYK